jgi:hypothetical protein
VKKYTFSLFSLFSLAKPQRLNKRLGFLSKDN